MAPEFFGVNKMDKKHYLFAGFMLFSMFFGAGNLIFPPLLGMEAGAAFIPAVTGFILTAVFLPLLAILAVTLSNNGLLEIGQRVHPLFGLVFAIIIYMSIGAFYGIPRASNVAYELGFVQMFNVEGTLALFTFSVVFFILTYLFSINPKKVVDYVGRILTPALLAVLAVLFIQAFRTFQYNDAPVTDKYEASPFLSGFLEGYFTMDAIAALAFGIVIINGLKSKGAADKKSLVQGTLTAGLIASAGLMIVYLSLGWIGRVLPVDQPVTDGAEIIVIASQLLFGSSGSIVFGMIILLACLTTCVGLTSACASFFHETFPKFSYSFFTTVFVGTGFVFTNFGLAVILDIAVPLLVLIYPLAIVLISLSLFQHFFQESRKMYVYSVAVTSVFAVYESLNAVGIQSNELNAGLSYIPLHDNGLGWVLPALIAAAFGYFAEEKREDVEYESKAG